MLENRKLQKIAALFALFSTEIAFAKPEIIYEDQSPLIFSLGAVSIDYINPTFNTEDEAWGAMLSASGQLMTRGEGTQYLLEYDTELINWQSSEEAAVYDAEPTMTDLRVRGLGRFFISQDWQVDIEAQHHQKDEPYGTGLSRLREDIFAPDNRTINSAMITALYGQDLLDRYVSLSAGVRDRTYDDINGYGPRFDAFETTFDGEIGFAISPATQLLLNAGVTQYDFDQVTLEDSDVYEVSVGVSWLPSAASTLRAVVGGFYREFEVQESSSSFLWDFLYQWRPNNRFILIVDSKSEAVATDNELSSDSVLSESNLFMAYRYSARWSTNIRGGYKKTEFKDTDGSQDITEQDFIARLIFSFSTFQSITLEYQWNSLSSRDRLFDYEQNKIGINWQYVF